MDPGLVVPVPLDRCGLHLDRSPATGRHDERLIAVYLLDAADDAAVFELQLDLLADLGPIGLMDIPGPLDQGRDPLQPVGGTVPTRGAGSSRPIAPIGSIPYWRPSPYATGSVSTSVLSRAPLGRDAMRRPQTGRLARRPSTPRSRDGHLRWRSPTSCEEERLRFARGGRMRRAGFE